MDLHRKRLVIRVLVFILFWALGIVSYTTFLSYQKYEGIKESRKISTLIEQVELLTYQLKEERIKSAAYLQFKTKGRFQNLVSTREPVDNSLNKLKTFVHANEQFKPYDKQLKQLERALQQVRRAAETFSNHRTIFFYQYHGQVYGSLSDMLKELSLNQNNETIKIYTDMYRKVSEIQENTILEYSIIYFMLLGSQAMDDQDRVIWNQVIGKDILPKYDVLPDLITVIDLRTLLSPGTYQNILSEERQELLKDSYSGQYKTNIVNWLGKINQKMSYFSKVESTLRTQIGESTQRLLTDTRDTLTINGIVIILLLYLLYKLMSQYQEIKIQRDKELFKDTLRDIELVFDKEQQRELKRLIDGGKINLIYKFLIKAIEDSNRTKDLFLANMSHEIRTPLNGILGFTQLLKETKLNDEQEGFVTTIEKSSESLLTIVNDILDLSKIKAEKIDIENIAFDPVEHFEASVESYGAKASEKNIDFQLYVDPKLPPHLMGDPTKISQVIVNLISNAVKFTPKGGEVNVKIEQESETEMEVEVRFSVSDTGIGITKEQRKKIFEAFAQADVSTSRKYGGTGLGLAISGKLVKLMGGELQIKSIKDEGSTFYFNLKLQKPEELQSRTVLDMSSYKIGVVNPHIDKKYFINKNLAKYVAYTGAVVEHYTDEQILALKGTSNIPDILFVDHKYRYREGELEQFLDIGMKTVVLTTGDRKRNLEPHLSKIDKIIYKPVNYTKVLDALSGKKEEVTEEKREIRFNDLNILVAEDNPINQKLLLNILNKLGITVSFAQNGQEALDMCKENTYDMIFMDIEMPVMGGMEATAKIISYEKVNKKAHIPIIALTANALTSDREKYLGAGMDGYMAKPIELDILMELLEEHFSHKITT